MDANIDFSENYESFIDLFTLLSFALIIASFIFGIHKAHVSDMTKITEIKFDKIGSGAGLPVGIPPNILILILMKQNNNNIIHIVKSGGINFKKNISDTTDLELALKSHQDIILNAEDIRIVLFKNKTKPNYEFYVYIQEWLTKNGIDKVKVYFQ